MVTYKYAAISKSGEKVSGIIEGFNEFDAAERIRETCDIVLKLTPVKDKDRDDTGFLNMEIGGNKLDSKAFTLMCSQFAVILKSGVPIGRTVQLIAEKTTNRPLRKMLKKVAEDVEAGRSLSASFAERGEKLLPPTFIETIRAGEESGNLNRSFESMSRHYEKQSKMRAKVRGAMIYPAFVLIIAVVVVIVLMVKVVPTFTATFEELGAELPGMTKALIAISNFSEVLVADLWHSWHSSSFLKLYGNTEEGRINLAKLQLQPPGPGQYRPAERRKPVRQHHGHDAGGGTAHLQSHLHHRQGPGQLLHQPVRGQDLRQAWRRARLWARACEKPSVSRTSWST